MSRESLCRAYSGHERLDVVKYRNETFLPAMIKYKERLRAYQVDDVNVEIEVEEQSDGNGGYLPRLVLVAHDESTFNANDDQARTWVYKDEYRLKHKGKGRGIMASEFICSTIGHLKDAGHTIDFGKAHDGYWCGDDVVKQVLSLCNPFDRQPFTFTLLSTGARKGNSRVRSSSSSRKSIILV